MPAIQGSFFLGAVAGHVGAGPAVEVEVAVDVTVIVAVDVTPLEVTTVVIVPVEVCVKMIVESCLHDSGGTLKVPGDHTHCGCPLVATHVVSLAQGTMSHWLFVLHTAILPPEQVEGAEPNVQPAPLTMQVGCGTEPVLVAVAVPDPEEALPVTVGVEPDVCVALVDGEADVALVPVALVDGDADVALVAADVVVDDNTLVEVTGFGGVTPKFNTITLVNSSLSSPVSSQVMIPPRPWFTTN